MYNLGINTTSATVAGRGANPAPRLYRMIYWLVRMEIREVDTVDGLVGREQRKTSWTGHWVEGISQQSLTHTYYLSRFLLTSQSTI